MKNPIQKLGDVSVAPVVEVTTNEYAEYAKVNRYDQEKKVPESETILFVNGQPVGDKGNFVTITGLAKSRKSVVISAIVTSILSGSNYIGFECSLKDDDRVVHLDTEQGESHYYRGVKRMYTDAGLDSLPDKKVTSYSMRDAPDEEFMIGFIKHVLTKDKPRVLILDGVADICVDINDQKEAKRTARLMQQLSKEFECLIILVIHITKGTGNMTGALGTKLEQKCQSAIQVDLLEDHEDTTSTVWCKMSRDRRFKTFNIEYNDQTNKYDMVDEKQVTTKGKGGDKSPSQYSDEIINRVITIAFGHSESMKKSEFSSKIVRGGRDACNDTFNKREQKIWLEYFKDMHMIIDGEGDTYLRTKISRIVVSEPVKETPIIQPGFDFDKPPENDDLPF